MSLRVAQAAPYSSSGAAAPRANASVMLAAGKRPTYKIVLENQMNEQNTGLDMELSSGIAAFESRQFTRAGRLLSPLAEAGDPDAQYRMAIMAQNGLGMHDNLALAFRYMQQAAQSGHALAQHGLAFMYLEGECTDQDGEKAVEWFKKAAEQGLAGSQTTLGMMYEEGRGVAQDMDEARKWYKLAGFEK
jgi:TPR repeat protein